MRIVPIWLAPRGLLSFQEGDGATLHCVVGVPDDAKLIQCDEFDSVELVVPAIEGHVDPDCLLDFALESRYPGIAVLNSVDWRREPAHVLNVIEDAVD